jgi:predicted MFS family arabinose efflux permease
MNRIFTRISTMPRDFMLFFMAVALIGFAMSIVNAIFNNFLNDSFSMTNVQRGILELPRELPGFLVVFYSAVFFFLSTRRLAALANLVAALGVVLIALYPGSYSVMLVWLFIFSSGQHIFLPLNQSIGMEFAGTRGAGRRLGQLTGAMNLAAIAGSFMIFTGFRYLGFTFVISFCISGGALLAAALCLFFMKPDRPQPAMTKFTLRREYGLYYWLTILYGTRKQIFLTFAPWVLVTVFNQKTEILATLLTIGGVIGIFFNPLLGRAIDRLGERFILMSEALVLIVVCLAYGFARDIMAETAALVVVSACFIIDQLLMSVGMARATYVKKIAVRPEDVSQTLTMGVSIDHIFSISIALISGVVWMKLGYQYVFLIGALIAVINLISASRIRLPHISEGGP